MKKQTQKTSKRQKLLKFTKTIIEKVFLVLVAFALVYLFVKSLNEEENTPQVPEVIVEFSAKDPEFIYQDEEAVTIDHHDYDAEGLDQIIEQIDAEPTLVDMIATGVSFDITQPQNSHFESIYELYEEDLPTNIIDYNGRKKIKDIDISLSKKPAYFGKIPVIAIVIDDMGISKKRTRDINSLHAPITSSFLTYAEGLKPQIKASEKAGHEIIAHIPMEAMTKKDVAPSILSVDMSKKQTQAALKNMLAKFDTLKGINNHMGSKFTENHEHMRYVMEILGQKDIFFLDSKTSAKSKGRAAAAEYNVRYAARNVFLDNKNDYDYIMGQLKITERLARKNGYAIAIGHPKSQTYLALKDWLETLDEKGLKLVPLSTIVNALNHHHTGEDMTIFAHRGYYGVTDSDSAFLTQPDVKPNLKDLAPENSATSIKAAFDKGYNVEIDVIMTQDGEVLVTHTNNLNEHSKDAIEGDLVTTSTLAKIQKMKTGLGGQTEPFMLYTDFIKLLKKYPDLKANVEIKGTLRAPHQSLPEPQNPSLIDKLVETTPNTVTNRIIWSSFSLSNLIKIKGRYLISEAAQLFSIPDGEEYPLYPDTDDKAMQFTIKNLEMVLKKFPNLDAVHPSIDSLTDETVKFCADKGLTIRTWSLKERNPAKNEAAKNNILKVQKYKQQYPGLHIDIITDYPDQVKSILTTN